MKAQSNPTRQLLATLYEATKFVQLRQIRPEYGKRNVWRNVG